MNSYLTLGPHQFRLVDYGSLLAGDFADAPLEMQRFMPPPDSPALHMEILPLLSFSVRTAPRADS